MFDLNVTFENKETNHRVIVGKEYSEDVDLEPEEVLAMTFAFLLRNKVPRQTEGELLPYSLSDVQTCARWNSMTSPVNAADRGMGQNA